MFHGRGLGARAGLDLIMVRWRAAVYGAVAFLAAHVIIQMQWPILAGAHVGEPAWFANSSGSLIVAVLAMVAAGFGAARGIRDGNERTLAAVNVSVGGVTAMIAAMLVVGGGTIAPLAALLSGAMLVAGTFAGGIIASLLAPRR